MPEFKDKEVDNRYSMIDFLISDLYDEIRELEAEQKELRENNEIY